MSETKMVDNQEQNPLVMEFRGVTADNLSYDYYKHMISLSVLAVGGVLTISEKVFSGALAQWQMFAAAGFFAASGLYSLQCQADLLQIARGRKTSSRYLALGERISTALMGAGIGSFLALLITETT